MARSLGSPAHRRDEAGTVNGEELHRHVTRLVSLLDERDAIGQDIKDIYEQAREAGVVTARLRQLVKEDRTDQDALEAQLLLMEAYRDALAAYRKAMGGMADTALGKAGAPKQPATVTVLSERQPAKRGRKPKARAAVQAADISELEIDLDEPEPAGAA